MAELSRRPITVAPEPAVENPLTTLGMWVGRHAGIYLAGSGVTLVLGLVQMGVVTRFLEPGAFGRVALLLLLAALLTTVYNLGTLQATLSTAFGATEDEEVDDDESPRVTGPDARRRVLGTGLLTTALIASLGTIAAVLLSSTISAWLLESGDDNELVILAVISGGMGAVWRLQIAIPRLELRPVTYVVLSVVRAVLVIGFAVGLLAAGEGVRGVIAGTALGSTTAVAVGCLANRHSVAFVVDRDSLRLIWERARVYALIMAGIWVATNADTYIVSRYFSSEDVGFYRVAARVAAVVAYVTSAAMTAWGPLRRTEMFKVAETAEATTARSRFLTYFLLISYGLLLSLTVASDTLVKIAPPEYSSAATLIPLIGAGLLLCGLMMALLRNSKLPHKRVYRVASALGAASIFGVSAALLSPAMGPSGTALSMVIGFAIPTVAVVLRSQLGSRPIDLQWRRIRAGSACTAASLALVLLAHALPDPWRSAAEILILVSFPGQLVLAGAIPRHHLHSLRLVITDALRSRSRHLRPEDLKI